eukprot:9757193-Ditylum_brightwellii.AAC.1
MSTTTKDETNDEEESLGSTNSITSEDNPKNHDEITIPENFQATESTNAKSLTDGVALASYDISKTPKKALIQNNVIMPWIGYGTYRLGQKNAYDCTLDAIQVGYRCIDTAFIYGGETTESEVGRAIRNAINDKTLRRRSDIFVITKHWRKYHGYDATHE